jgi:hypothetical protein
MWEKKTETLTIEDVERYGELAFRNDLTFEKIGIITTKLYKLMGKTYVISKKNGVVVQFEEVYNEQVK